MRFFLNYTICLFYLFYFSPFRCLRFSERFPNSLRYARPFTPLPFRGGLGRGSFLELPPQLRCSPLFHKKGQSFLRTHQLAGVAGLFVHSTNTYTCPKQPHSTFPRTFGAIHGALIHFNTELQTGVLVCKGTNSFYYNNIYPLFLTPL
jgi:hypothetical protein